MKSEYGQRLSRLREKKIHQTREKLEYEGYLDEDDYGRVVPAFEWHIIPNDPDGNFYGIDGWTENFCSLMEKHDVFIDEDDAFCGRWMYFMSKMRPSQFKQSLLPGELKKAIDFYQIDASIGFDAHFCPDYRIGLELGWGGLIGKINAYKEKNASAGGETAHFYDCHIRVIRSIQSWIRKHIRKLDELIAGEKDEAAKKEWQEKKLMNESILEKAPETLREALQWMIWYHLASRTFNRDGAGGQLDALLQPYYERDIQNHIIDRDTAVYYLGCFLINDPVYWQIGGPGKDGRDQSSEMSFIILDAAEHINVSLNITLRVHDTMNQELFDKAVRLLITYKEAWPRFSGDNALVEGFCRLGYSKELARERIAVGCNWMSLPGMEYTVNDLFKVNFVKVFEIAWQTMMDRCGYPGLGGNIGSYTPMIKGSLRKVRETPSVNFLWNIFLEHLQKAVHVCADAVRFHLAIQADNEVELMLNLLSHGPLEKGLDVSHGGAQYYNLAIDGAGLGTVADAFTALEQRVETGNNLSWETLNMMLRTNWEGSQGEEFRRMMKSSRRYGSSTSGDAWGEKVSREFSAMVRGESSGGNVFIPGLFSWAKTHLLGRTVGATPDGRRYGDPITHGANPSPGFAEDAAVLAQTSIIARVQPGYGNTAPLQLEFDPFSLKEDPAELVKALILAHFDLGGTLININIFDKSKLLEAHKNPEKYPDLIVRVTGFTAYFCMLTPEFRQLVVNRILQN